MTHVNFAMTTLLNGIWQGAILAAAMWILLKLLPRLNPTTRFTVLWVTLLAVVALPLGPLAPRAFIPGAQPDSLPIAATNTPRHDFSRPLRFGTRVQLAEYGREPRVTILHPVPRSKPESGI